MDCRECVLSKHEKGVVVWCSYRQKWVNPDTDCDRKKVTAPQSKSASREDIVKLGVSE